MSQLPVVNRSQVFAAATAITAAGFLTFAPPAQAHPMLPLPLAPACSQWGFPGPFTLQQTNNDTVRFNSTGSVASGQAVAGRADGTIVGQVSGGIRGDKLDFTISWNSSVFSSRAIGRYTGTVGDDGFAHGGTHDELSSANAHWDSTVPLVCITAAAPASAPASQPAPAQQPPSPDAQPAAARLGISVNGPTTLKAGMSGTYTANVSNPGDVSAPVELFIIFGGNLQQTPDQVTPSGGFNCEIRNYAGGTASVHCTVPQLPSKATATITVQGRGLAPGAAQLDVNINSSDPAAQFVQKSQRLNVSIT
jgi:hypothetical protein